MFYFQYWPWDPLKLKEHTKHFNKVLSFIKSEIRQHKAELDVDHAKDYIDSYLVEGVKTDDPLFKDEGRQLVYM